MRVAVVVSQFNEKFMGALLQGCLERLRELAIPETAVSVVRVPGSVEIPIAAQAFARTEKYSVIIALGIVMRGDTTHYDYVCQQVSNGCQRVALDHNLPVIFGVLTTENAEQTWARLGGGHGHKGREAAEAALQMVKVLEEIRLLT